MCIKNEAKSRFSTYIIGHRTTYHDDVDKQTIFSKKKEDYYDGCSIPSVDSGGTASRE